MSFRLEKANATIQKKLTEIIYELNDPRLVDEVVTVLKVSLSPDLKNAKVHISIFGDKDETQAFLAIKNASGFIRHELASRIDYRVLPALDFEIDKSEEYGQNIDEILKTIKKKTSQNDDK